jgi:hypothetical protein
MSLTNAGLTNCETRKLDNISHFSLLARFVRLARLALIFSREKNYETRLAVNPTGSD